MSNPYAKMREEAMRNKARAEEWEEVDGPLQCQQCWLVADTGLYSNKLKIVTWKCDDGHESRMEYQA